MPKIVDWDARRDEILSATWWVIARDGITRVSPACRQQMLEQLPESLRA